MVRLEELPQIAEAYKLADSVKIPASQPSVPKITTLVVGKRNHARFYPVVPGQKQLGAGLVVDTDAVNPNYSNFHLQSHDSPLGTVRSAHYVVLLNQSGYKLNKLQELNL